MSTPCLAVRIWQRLRSPIPQNRNAIMFTGYRGQSVVLRPKVSADRPWLVEEWIPDPDECKAIDEEADREQAVAPAGPAGDAPPELPKTDEVPDFNPSGCSGL